MQLSSLRQTTYPAAQQSLLQIPACKTRIHTVCTRSAGCLPCAAVGNKSSGVHSGGESPVARILQQHRLLMEAGFTYDQASLVLQITQHGNPFAGDTHQAAEAHGTAPHHIQQVTSPDEGGFDQQQQQKLDRLNQRISFLETELLKQSIVLSDQVLLAGTTRESSGHLSSPVLPGLNNSEPYCMPHGLGSQPHALQAEALEPGVAAVAQALAVRRGRMLPAAAVSQSVAEAEPLSDSCNSIQQPSSIWSKNKVRQLQAKPWRYWPRAADVPQQHFHGSQGSVVKAESDLAAYEPAGSAAAVGTILVVYLGVLVTFVAMLAVTPGDVSPDLLLDLSL